MFYIVFVIVLFIISVLVHILYCRQTSKPGLQAKAFVLIALVSWGIYVMGVLSLPYARMLNEQSLWGLPFKISAGIIFILLVPVYLCFYVLTQLTSPSKKILSVISKRGEISLSDILVAVKKEDFINSRLNDLCASGCVTQINGRYTLSPDGQKIMVILNTMQGILGRKVGG